MRERDRRILEIIRSRPISTQSRLQEELLRFGIRVTQATVSRDIKRLGLVKTPVGGGAYRYQHTGSTRSAPGDLEGRLRRAAAEYVTGVDEGSGLVLVKTSLGCAGAVAEAIDEVDWPEIAGTVAGDNTIIVVPRKPAQRAVILKRLRSLG